MKNKNSQTGMMIGAFVTLIIGVLVASVIFDQVSSQTSITAVADDTFTGATTCTRVTTECFTAGSATGIVNSTSDDVSALVTQCGANERYYGFATDAALTGQTINVSYAEVGCNQLTGTTRSIVSYLPVLLAVALIVFVAGMLVFRS